MSREAAHKQPESRRDPCVCAAAVRGQPEGVKDSSAGGKHQISWGKGRKKKKKKSREAKSSSRFRHNPSKTTADLDEGNGTKKFNNLLYLCSTFHPQSILRT